MEEDAIKQLWHSYNTTLEESVLLSKANANDITEMKVQSLLSSMKPIKIFAIVVGMIWVGVGSTIVINLFINAFAYISPFFLFSASVQLLLTAVALVIYSYQVVLIAQVDISGPVLATQETLASLKSSTLWVARFLFLQLPVWTIFYWNSSMLENGNVVLYALQITVTLSCTVLAIWLFRNIRYENRDKQWFRLMFNGNEWSPLMKSMELLRQIESYRK